MNPLTRFFTFYLPDCVKQTGFRLFTYLSLPTAFCQLFTLNQGLIHYSNIPSFH
jgi:hypothetical protein